MSVVTANFVKRGKIGNEKVKATIRYIQHRPGKDHERLTRTLFGSDGPMQRFEVYQFIDEAPKGTVFFRFVINPDPVKEDRFRDIDMRAIAQTTMLTIETRVQTPVMWAAAVHDDHTDKRHIHALAAIQGRLERPDLDCLIEETTQACLEQRGERDQYLEKQEREQEWEVFEWGL
jgi:hypothetical protein